MLKATQVEWEDQISQWEQKKVYFVIACVELYTFSRNSSAAVSENSMCFPTLILPHFLLKIENVGIEQIEEN